VGENVWGFLGFVALVCIGCISAVVVKGVSVRYCRGLGVCMVSEVD
jgi:hypothetical protein